MGSNDPHDGFLTTGEIPVGYTRDGRKKVLELSFTLFGFGYRLAETGKEGKVYRKGSSEEFKWIATNFGARKLISEIRKEMSNLPTNSKKNSTVPPHGNSLTPLGAETIGEAFYRNLAKKNLAKKYSKYGRRIQSWQNY